MTLGGTIFIDGEPIRKPKLMHVGNGAPQFCWVCFKPLQRAPGVGESNVYFNLVQDPLGHRHRVHGDPCTVTALQDGNILVKP